LSRQPVQADAFIKICEGLEVKDWRELAELELVLDQCEQATQAQTRQGDLAHDSREVGESFRRVTVLNPIGEIKAEIIFEGSLEVVTADVQRLIEICLSNAGGDTIRITDVRSGSVRVTIQGSPKDIAKLLDQINSGELTKVESFPIQDCQILSKDFLADVGQHSNSEKWQIIGDIVNKPQIGRQLSGADLSDADLNGAILISANLTNVDLSGADLSNADLRNLNDFKTRRDLHARQVLLALRDRGVLLALLARGFLFSSLDLRDRFDRSADLEGADLTDTIVEGCLFGDGVGLTSLQKEYLKRRGGIFNDAPGNRGNVESRSPSPTRR
jgi:Pentapeptide repeats (8 copies)